MKTVLSTSIILVVILLVWFLVSGAVAYRYRSRHKRSLGQKPPPFLAYLFAPFRTAFNDRLSIPRPLRIVLGLILGVGGVLSTLAAIVVFSEAQARNSGVVSGYVLVAIFVGLAIVSLSIGFRLITMKSETEYLFGGERRNNGDTQPHK